jgi:hypothetical protein
VETDFAPLYVRLDILPDIAASEVLADDVLIA